MRHAWKPVWKVDGGGLGAIAVLALVWWGLGVQPLMEARASREREKDELIAKRDELRALEDQAQSTDARVARLKQEIEGANVRLARSAEVNWRVDGLTQLALDAGLRLDAIKPGEPVPGAKYTTVPIRISGLGTYQTSAAFLRAMHERFPDVGIASFDLRAKPEPPVTKATCTFDLVWFTQPTAPPAPVRGKNTK